jgi:hypothetical protein
MTLTIFESFIRRIISGQPVVSAKRPESMLRSYQRYLADCIVEMPGLLGAAEMSLGKTAATLTGVKRLLRSDPKLRCLIVAFTITVQQDLFPQVALRR